MRGSRACEEFGSSETTLGKRSGADQDTRRHAPEDSVNRRLRRPRRARAAEGIACSPPALRDRGALRTSRSGAKAFAVFTGLVEDVGRLVARTARGPGARLTVETKLAPLVLGESVAVMGVCLTVDAVVAGGFEADASAETLARSTLGALAIGSGVHLERAMAMGGRMGGHIVSGHVDARAKLLTRRAVGQSVELAFGMDLAVRRYVAAKGSITIDGVSLTVNEVGADRFTVMIVPHTQGATLLASRRAGEISNVEVDVLARYVARCLDVAAGERGSGESTDDGLKSSLAAAGFL